MQLDGECKPVSDNRYYVKQKDEVLETRVLTYRVVGMGRNLNSRRLKAALTSCTSPNPRR